MHKEVKRLIVIALLVSLVLAVPVAAEESGFFTKAWGWIKYWFAGSPTGAQVLPSAGLYCGDGLVGGTEVCDTGVTGTAGTCPGGTICGYDCDCHPAGVSATVASPVPLPGTCTSFAVPNYLTCPFPFPPGPPFPNCIPGEVVGGLCTRVTFTCPAGQSIAVIAAGGPAPPVAPLPIFFPWNPVPIPAPFTSSLVCVVPAPPPAGGGGASGGGSNPNQQCAPSPIALEQTKAYQAGQTRNPELWWIIVYGRYSQPKKVQGYSTYSECRKALLRDVKETSTTLTSVNILPHWITYTIQTGLRSYSPFVLWEGYPFPDDAAKFYADQAQFLKFNEKNTVRKLTDSVVNLYGETQPDGTEFAPQLPIPLYPSPTVISRGSAWSGGPNGEYGYPAGVNRFTTPDVPGGPGGEYGPTIITGQPKDSVPKGLIRVISVDEGTGVVEYPGGKPGGYGQPPCQQPPCIPGGGGAPSTTTGGEAIGGPGTTTTGAPTTGVPTAPGAPTTETPGQPTQPGQPTKPGPGVTVSQPGPEYPGTTTTTGELCGLDCEPSDGWAYFYWIPQEGCPPGFRIKCGDVATESPFHAPGWGAFLNKMLEKCCKKCTVDCSPAVDGKTAFKFTPPGCGKDFTMNCNDVITDSKGLPAGVTAADINKKKDECCDVPTDSGCKGTPHWDCDIPKSGKLTRHTVYAPPKCKPDKFEEFPCADAVKEGADKDGAVYKACCPAPIPVGCFEFKLFEECEFDAKCTDPKSGASYGIGPTAMAESPFWKWVHEFGIGTAAPCPYENYCKKAVKCDCAEMLKKYGGCDSPLLTLFAGTYDMNAWATKEFCCMGCKEGEERECYSGPTDTEGVGTCVPGKQTCKTVAKSPGSVPVKMASTWGCAPKPGEGSNAGKTCYSYYTGSSWAYVCDDQCKKYSCEGMNLAGPSEKDEKMPDGWSSGQSEGGAVIMTDICQPPTVTTEWGDCEGEVTPGDEVCNGIDDNCNALIDEGFDTDGDGVPDCLDCVPENPAVHGSFQSPSTESLSNSPPYPPSLTSNVFNVRDDSSSLLLSHISTTPNSDYVPPASETCDGIDNDCDQLIDEGCQCVEGQTRPCSSNVGACSEGTQTCVNSVWSSCQGGVMPTYERCNGVDDDCNTVIDNNCDDSGGRGGPGDGSTGSDSTGTAVGVSPGFEPCLGAISDGKKVTVETLPTNQFPLSLIPQDVELIELVKTSACDGQSVQFRRSISNIWNDVQVLSCTESGCSTITKEITEEMTCGGVSLDEVIVPQLTSRKTVMGLDQMESVVRVGKAVSEAERSVSTGKYSIEFPGVLPSSVVTLSRPSGSIELPENSCLAASGTPLVVIAPFAKQPMPARLIMPVVPLQNADPSSYKIFAWQNNRWHELESRYDVSNGVVIADIPDLTIYLNNMGEGLFLVAGLTCHALEESCVKMSESGSDEVNVLVHGFTSTVDTWWPLVAQAQLNNEKYDWVGYAYPPSYTMEKASNGLVECLSTLGKYKKINIVSHSVGGKITLKALDKMYKDKERYTTIYNIHKVIGLGVPNLGVDVHAITLLAEFLQTHRTLARAFNRDSAILDELTKPEQEIIKPVPPWAQFIAVAGTEECDYARWFFTEFVSIQGKAGAAVSLPQLVDEFLQQNDCLITVQNALSWIDEQRECSNVFTPKVWHPKLNDRADMRRLILYLLNAEKAKEDPLTGFDGMNQYVLWDDVCQPEKTYAVVGKRAPSRELPLFCNCGNNVCEPDLGEDMRTCPSDCNARGAFWCNIFANFSSILLLILSITFVAYLARKYVIKREERPSKLWHTVMVVIIALIILLILLILFLCHYVPLGTLILLALMTILIFAEWIIGRRKYQVEENRWH